jgi:hypothetical protein
MIIFFCRLQSNYSLSLTLLCYLQTIQAINALTSLSDRHNYKKTEQCNSSIQDGLFEHSVTLLSYLSPCLRGNFSTQKGHKERGRVQCSSAQRARLAPAGKPSLGPVLSEDAWLPEKDSAPSSASSSTSGTRSTQHALESNFRGLNSCNPSYSPQIPGVGEMGKERQHQVYPRRYVWVSFSPSPWCTLVLVPSHPLHPPNHIHHSSLASAGVHTWAQRDRAQLLQVPPEKPRGLRAFPSSTHTGTAPVVTFGIGTVPQSSGWESNGAGLLDRNDLGQL